MKSGLLLVLGLALIGAGIFLILRGRAMWTTVDYQMNSLPDTWHHFMNRWGMFGYGAGAIFFGGLCIYAAFVNWF